MRVYTKQHQFYCSIDLHARLAICVLDQAGAIVLQTQIPADKQRLLDLLAPYRPDVAAGLSPQMCLVSLAAPATTATTEPRGALEASSLRDSTRLRSAPEKNFKKKGNYQRARS